MTNLKRPGAIVLAMAMSVPLMTAPALASDITTHTPNILPANLNAAGVYDFRITHRMSGSLNSISAMPTFSLDGQVLPWLDVRLAWADKMAVVGPAYLDRGPMGGNNELNLGFREQLLREDDGAPLSLVLSEFVGAAGVATSSAGLSSKSPQFGADLTLGRKFGPFGLVAALHGLDGRYAVYGTNQYENGTGYYRLGGTVGATYAITPFLTLAADWGKYFAAGDTSAMFYVDNSKTGMAGVPAWSVALQSNIPFTPHQFSVEVSDVPTVTYGGQGAVQIPENLFVGFTFSIGFSDLPRWQKLITPTWMEPAPQEESEVPEPAASAAPVAAATPAPAATPGLVTSNNAPAATPAPAATAAPVAPAEDPALIARGKKLFTTAKGMGCTACHGPEGKGTDMAPNIRGKGEADIRKATKGSSMGMFADMKDSEFKALGAYLKSLAKR